MGWPEGATMIEDEPGGKDIGGNDAAAPEDEDGFERHRARLFGLAYRMLGGVADAEDIVQDAYLRWQGTDRSGVANPEAYLSRIVTNMCLDHMRSARARRETYVGPWLPEPLIADDRDPPGHAVEVAHDVSVALMLALERLSPLERAAFLLHDVFDQSFDSVGETLGRSAAACRQLASRARTHVRAARPRHVVAADEGTRIVNAFSAAIRDGDLDGLKGMLAADATLFSDGGGRIPAALHPIHGADRITRFFIGIARKFGNRFSTGRPAIVNGLPGAVSIDPHGNKQTIAFEIADGRIAAIYLQRNPEKLGHVALPEAGALKRD